MTSLVARRIAELEATSGSSSARSAASFPRSSGATTPAFCRRERLHIGPPSIVSNDSQPDSRDGSRLPTPRDDAYSSASDDDDDDDHNDYAADDTVLPSPSSVVEPRLLLTPGIHHHHHHHHHQEYREEPNYDHAGGYYSRSKRVVLDNPNGANSCSVAAAVAAASGQQQQLQENRRMARKIAQLEADLAMSHGRIAHLVSSSAKAAETASHRRRESEAAKASEQACVRRICELEDTLEHAAKRASWLQSELQVVWACSIQRVGELENELERTRQEGGEERMSAETGSCPENEAEYGYADTSGGSSLYGEIVESGSRCYGMVVQPGDGLDQMMNQTQEALSGLRAKFYRAMGERNKLKARCDDLEGKLLDGGANTNSVSVNSSTTHGDEDIEDDNGDDDSRAFDSSNGRESTKTIGSRVSGDTNEGKSINTIESNDSVENETATSLPAAPQTTRSTSKIGITSSISSNTTIPTATGSNHEDGEDIACSGCTRYGRGTSSNSRGSGNTRKTRSISSNSSSSNSSRATAAVVAASATSTVAKFSPWRWSPPARTGPRPSIPVDE